MGDADTEKLAASLPVLSCCAYGVIVFNGQKPLCRLNIQPIGADGEER